MKRFARLLLVTAGFGVLGFVMSLVPQKNATGAGGAPVNIVSSVPLSVAGSVNAAQTGNWNVGITGTPTVNANVTFPSTLSVQSVPGSTTHVGQASSQLVTLAFSALLGFVQVHADGTSGAAGFSIPAGHSLVVTDLEWDLGVALSPGSTADFELTVAGTPVYASAALVDPNGFVVGHDALTNGIVITQTPDFTVEPFTALGIHFVLLHGYLIPTS